MRLLDTQTLQLSEFFEDSVPEYAILSHTWDRDEVTYRHIQSLDVARGMQGFAKVEGACRLAAREGFKYIWIDTCCIDKSSSAELSEAINSMYSWYQKSAKCYAYLADVDHLDFPDDTTEFEQSRWHTRGWTLQELTVRDATLYLLFLQANGVVSYSPTHDAWFKSTKIVGQDLETRAVGYGQDTPASPMGCLLRHQYCNASGSCAAMDTNGGFPDAVMSIFPDESSYARAAWFDELATGAFDLGPVVHGRDNLQARYGLFAGVLDVPLPENQWQIEVAYWFSIMMASVQKSSVEVAAGSWNDALLPFISRPVGPEQADFCMSQKITSPYYTSFSMFGIMFIFTLGTIVIILGMTLPSIASFFQKRLKKDPHARLEWCANDTLQLQRLAHEELGLGKWSHGTKSIPMTKGDINLGVLDLTDLKHPRLTNQDSEKENVVGIANPEAAMEEETLVSEARVSLSTSREESEDTGIGSDEDPVENAEARPPEETISQGRGGSQEIQRAEASSPSLR